MKTININLYEFDELSKEVQEKVISNHSDINVDFNWWESTYDDAKEIGLKITSFGLDRDRHAKGKFTESPLQVAKNIMKNHGKECETYITANAFINDYENLKEDEIEELKENFLTDLLEDYSIILQNECEYLQSNEAITETIKSNGYTFEDNGKMRNA